MNFKCIIPIDREITNKLQAMQYFYQGSKDILITILTNPSLSINNDKFYNFVDKYITDYSNYEVYKAKIESEYLLKILEIGPNTKFTWAIDYTLSTMVLQAILTNDEYEKIQKLLKKYGYKEINNDEVK